MTTHKKIGHSEGPIKNNYLHLRWHSDFELSMFYSRIFSLFSLFYFIFFYNFIIVVVIIIFIFYLFIFFIIFFFYVRMYCNWCSTPFSSVGPSHHYIWGFTAPWLPSYCSHQDHHQNLGKILQAILYQWVMSSVMHAFRITLK